MGLGQSFAILALASVFMGLVGRGILRHYGYPPMAAAVLYVIAAVTIGIQSFTWILRAVAHPSPVELLGVAGGGMLMDQIIRLLCALFVYLPAIGYSVLMLNGLAAQALVDTLYQSSLSGRPKATYHRAWVMVHGGKTAEAIRLFRKYYDKEPDVPDPLFYLAELLSHEHRYMEALQRYGEIMRHFEKDEAVWSRAAFACAELYELKLHNPERARAVLETIVKRVKAHDLRQLANARLGRLPGA